MTPAGPADPDVDRSEPPGGRGAASAGGIGSAEDAGVLRIDLSSPVPVLRLERGGFRLILRARRRYHPLTPYQDVSHVAATGRGFWLASRSGLFFARRQRFRAPDGPERLAAEIVRRIAAVPDGLRQLQGMAEIDALARHPHRVRATAVVVALCLAVFVLQWRDPFFEHLTAFDPALVRAGEWWRLVTANFVHGAPGLPVHLLFNVLGLLGFGYLVERPLGSARVACVLGAAGIGSMATSGLLRPDPVIGASGMVAGLAGAALCLELHFWRHLPAWWRIPRRLFLGALLVQVLIDFNVEIIAGEAHIGGFVAGYAVAAALAGSALRRVPAGAGARLGAATAVALVVVSVAAVAPLWLRSSEALTRHARRLLAIEDASPLWDNQVAWIMATESDASPEQLESAVALAERAVAGTDRRDPDLLDTLAEVLFASGRTGEAIDAIDEAIALAPWDPYFWEQRKRFTGERAPDDRPEPPELPWFFRQPPEGPGPPEPEDEPLPEGSLVI